MGTYGESVGGREDIHEATGIGIRGGIGGRGARKVAWLSSYMCYYLQNFEAPPLFSFITTMASRASHGLDARAAEYCILTPLLTFLCLHHPTTPPHTLLHES